MQLRLSDLAHGRSGDKGNHANIAVLAYTAAGYDWLRTHITAEVVAHYFASLQPSRVVRYEAANVHGLNFLLHDVLAGGASRSLRSDTQGKTLALALLQMPIPTPENYLAMLRSSRAPRTLHPAPLSPAPGERGKGETGGKRDAEESPPRKDT